VPDIPDPIGAWRDATAELQRLAASLAGRAPAGARDVLQPLQRQTEVIEQLLRRQLAVEQQLIRNAIAPAQAAAEALERAPAAMHAQAAAFRAAAASFTQAAELMEIQAAALEQTLAIMRAPIQLGQRALGRRDGPDESP
jgi:hypothetical protein